MIGIINAYILHIITFLLNCQSYKSYYSSRYPTIVIDPLTIVRNVIFISIHIN